jgi:hypothetical protein
MVLEDHPYVAPKKRHMGRSDASYVMPIDRHPPGTGTLYHCDELEQGALARARMTGQKSHLTSLKVKVDVSQRLLATRVYLADLFEPNHNLAIPLCIESLQLKMLAV